MRDRHVAAVALDLQRVRPMMRRDRVEEDPVQRAGRGIAGTTARHHRSPLSRARRPQYTVPLRLTEPAGVPPSLFAPDRYDESDGRSAEGHALVERAHLDHGAVVLRSGEQTWVIQVAR